MMAVFSRCAALSDAFGQMGRESCSVSSTASAWLQEMALVTRAVKSTVPKGVIFRAIRGIWVSKARTSPVPSKRPENVDEMRTMRQTETIERRPPPFNMAPTVASGAV